MIVVDCQILFGFPENVTIHTLLEGVTMIMLLMGPNILFKFWIFHDGALFQLRTTGNGMVWGSGIQLDTSL